MPRGTVTVRILGDARGLTNELQSTSQQFRRFADGLSLTVTPALTALGVSSVNAASDLQQSAGAIESVFGAASTSISRFSRTASQELGLSRREVNETAAVLGASLQSMGFEADAAADQVIVLQQRAADMAATFGGSTKDALEAIASLMRGERDPIERYGVALKQADINARVMAEGLDISTTESQKLAEAQAGLSLLLEQTASTQGQFARETDTAAGSQARLRAEYENARAELGESLLPVMAEVADVAGGAFQAFGNLSDSTQTAVVAFAGLAAAAGPVISGVSRMGSALRGVAAAMAVSGPLNIGIAALAASLGILAAKWVEGEQRVSDLTDSLDENTGAITDNTKAQVRDWVLANNELMDNLGRASISVDEFTEAAVGNREAVASVSGKLQALETDLSHTTAEGQIARQTIGDITTSMELWNERIDEATTAWDAESEAQFRATEIGSEYFRLLERKGLPATQAIVEAYLATAEATDAVASAASDAGGPVEELAFAADDAADSVSTLRDRLDELNGVNLTATQKSIDYQAALASAREELDDGTASLDIRTESGRDNLAAVLDLIGASQDLTVALEEEGATAAEQSIVLQNHTSDLRAVMEQAGFTEQQIADLIEQYNLTPDEIRTTVGTTGVEDTLSDLARVRGAMEGVGQSIEEVAARLDIRVAGHGSSGGISLNDGYGAGPAPSISIHGGHGATGDGPGFGDGLGVSQHLDIETALTDILIKEMPALGMLQLQAGVPAMMQALRAVFPGLPLHSGYRPGSITATGNRSYHGMMGISGPGRAVDIPPDMTVFNAIANSPVAAITRELIFSPAGNRQLRNGNPHYYSGITRANHWDHIHWALANGGIVKATPGGTAAVLGEGGSDEAVIPLDRPLPVVIVDVSNDAQTRLNPAFLPFPSLPQQAMGPRPQGSAAVPFDPSPFDKAGMLGFGGLVVPDKSAVQAEMARIRGERDAVNTELNGLLSRRLQMEQQLLSVRKQAAMQEQQVLDARRDALIAFSPQSGSLASAGNVPFLFGYGTVGLPGGTGSTPTTLIGQLRESNQELTTFLDNLGGLRSSGLSEDAIALLGLDSPQQMALVEELSDFTVAEISELNRLVADRFALGSAQVQLEANNMLGGVGESLLGIRSAMEETADAVTSELSSIVSAIEDALSRLDDLNAEAGRVSTGGRPSKDDRQAAILSPTINVFGSQSSGLATEISNELKAYETFLGV